MVGLVLVCSGLLVAAPTEPATPSALEMKAYQDAKALAGRDPDKQVQLALWCEAHGLAGERLIHLARAVLAEPSHAAARGLMGMVPYQGRWEKPEAVADRVEADAKLTAALAEYNAKRAKAKSTSDDQWALAVWCEQHDLKAEASAHLTAVTRIDPKREAAWKRLGYKKHDGRWMTEEQVADQKTDREAQAKANQRWESLLAKWKGWLGKDKTRTEAEAALNNVDDPRAVPSVVKVFGKSNPVRAVQLLGQIDAPASSRMLAMVSIYGQTEPVRRAATETLRNRDPREYAHLLIPLIRDPVKYEVRPVGGPGSPGALFVEGKRFNIQRLYSPPSVPYVPLRAGDYVDYDDQGLPVVNRYLGLTNGKRITGDVLLNDIAQNQLYLSQMNSQVASIVQNPGMSPGARSMIELMTGLPQRNQMSEQAGKLEAAIHQVEQTEHKAPSQFGFTMMRPVTAQIRVGQMAIEARKAAFVAEKQLESDVALIERSNAEVRAVNGRVVQILNNATDQNLPEERDVWNAWWIDQLGYSYTSPESSYRPTVVQQVPLAYRPRPVLPTVVQGPVVAFNRMSCFAAGTLVRTLSGTRPIEDIQVGDRLLTRDTETGALSYQPVLVVHHNPPSKTLRINLTDDSIVSSVFHRFWRAGKGWAMARDLKPGDTLRTLNGQARVVSIEEDQIQPVFNLDVARNQTFFVGQGGTLVHDNTVPSPRDRRYDAPPALASRQEN